MRVRSTSCGLLAIAALTGTSLWAQTNTEPTPVSTTSDQSSSQAAQSSPNPDSSATAPSQNVVPKKSIWTIGKIDFSGMVDVYYSFNNNHPASGSNQLYNFDDKTDQFDLNLIKLTASHDPDPIGFRIDLGLGRTFDFLHTPAPDPEFFRYVEQAYVSLKPKGWKGFEADFGDFVTSAGAEVIETKDNWNYSRSLLFSYAIPYYHFGVRTSMPIGNSFTAGLQVINGWNVIVDDHGNNMQTVGLTAAVTRKKFTWTNNYYIGPQWTAVNNRNRALYDTVLLLTPNDKISAYLNFDYGQQRRPESGLDHWNGFAGAVHFQLTKHIALSPRAEYYNDSTGFTTGTQQRLHEVTVTGEYKVFEGLLGRLEYRHDGSNAYFYDRGTSPAVSKTQNTLTVGLVAWFAAKH